VRFFTTLREVTGNREKTLKFGDKRTVTIKAVLDVLSKRYGKSFAEYVFDRKTGEVKGFLQFLVNGRSTPTSEGLNVKLADGDVLAIIPPVGGG
jgi:MoaD family protein